MRWPWTGIQREQGAMREELGLMREELRLMRKDHAAHVVAYHRLTEETSRVTRECIARMDQIAARQDRHLDDLLAESRAHRQALLRMLDRLGPAPGAA